MEYKHSLFQLQRNHVAFGILAVLAAATLIVTANLAFAATTVQIDTVNGQSSPFNYSCPSNPLTNPVTITGSGTGDAPPGLIEQYRVQIDWGDGTQTNNLGTSTPSSGQGNFAFTFASPAHTYATSGPHTLTVRVYHAQPPGSDNQADQVATIPICVGTTTPGTGTLVVQKNVTNNSGGVATSSDFSVRVRSATSSADVSGSPAAGSATGTRYMLPAGTYVVSEVASSTYTPTFSGSCDSSGNVTVTNGATSTCVITNNDNATTSPSATSTVYVAKYLNGAQATASSSNSFQFPMTATWKAANLNGGATSSGSYLLGPTGDYRAFTSAMNEPANFATNEITSTSSGSVLPIGASCEPGKYRLVGYSSSSDSFGAAASSTISSSSPNFFGLTDDRYVIVWNEMCGSTTTPPVATSTVQVHILKYLDGQQATASSSNSFQFPMSATWMASNLSGGATSTGTFALGNFAGGAPAQYGAVTSEMSTSSNYAVHEVTSTSTGSVLPIGASCQPGKYRLVGYSTSPNSFASAASSSITSSSPSFFNLMSDRYVIVWNEKCGATTTPPTATSTLKVHIQKYLDGSLATASSSNSFQFPMTATWNAANLNGGATTTGSYVLGNSHGGASQLYGADTAAMSTSSNYSTREVTGTSTGMILPPGASCEPGKYRLVGYSTSPTSFAAAASSAVSTATPTFWGLNADQYVIVWNEKCGDGGQQPPPTADVCPASTPAGYTRVNGSVRNDRVTLQPNTMYVDPAGNDTIIGPDGNYIICSGSGNDTIELGDGNVAIYSGTGNDEITIGDGTATIVTDGGNDTVVTGNGPKAISTGTGNDEVITGSGADTIDVGNGNNTVFSDGGNDSIVAGNGNDEIDGGAGNDSCAAGGGNNEVVNCES